MRDVPEAMERVWRSGEYFGDQRPIARVTVQRPKMTLHDLSLPAKSPDPSTTGAAASGTPSTTSTTTGAGAAATPPSIQQQYADFLFGEGATTPVELPNLRDVQWTRSIDSDVAECRLTFWNTAPLPTGQVPTRDLDMPGFYTYNRGNTSYSTRWGQRQNKWAGLLMPDNLIRTYEGYGFTEGVPPERDTKLVLTGVWMIDQVDYSSDGMINVTCRDLGRLLLDQIVFPPITPADFYPLSFKATEKVSGFKEGVTYKTYVKLVNGVATPVETVASRHVDMPVNQPYVNGKPVSPVRLSLKYDASSNSAHDQAKSTETFDYTVRKDDYLIKLADRYDVAGGWRTIYNLNKAKIDATAKKHGKPGGGHWIWPGEVLQIPKHGGGIDFHGHKPWHAFDSDSGSYWLSAAHGSPNGASDYEWIQGYTDGKTLTQVRFNPAKDGVTAYLSVHDGKRWVTRTGAGTIPYRAGRVDVDANIPYVEKINCDKTSGEYTITLKNPIPNAKKVRLTFHNLQDFPNAREGVYKYRAGVQSITAYGYSAAAKPNRPKPAPPVPVSPFIKGVGDSFNRKDNPKTLGRADMTGDWWVYKDGGAGKGAIFGIKDNKAYRYGGKWGGNNILWVCASLEYRHHRMDGIVAAGRTLTATDNPTWYLAARFRQRGPEIYHVEASCTRRGLLKIDLVLNNVRTTLASQQLGNANTYDLTSGKKMRLSITKNKVSAWVVDSSVVYEFGEPTLTVTDDRVNDARMGWHVAFGSNDAKAAWEHFNAYGNVQGGVFDSFTRVDAGKLGAAETLQPWRISGPATANGTKGPDTWAIENQKAVRTGYYTNNGKKLWALANLGSITQDVSVWGFPADGGDWFTNDLWMVALRARDHLNMIYFTVERQSGKLSVYRVVGGKETELFTGTAVAGGIRGTNVLLRGTIIDTKLSIYINNVLKYELDDPDSLASASYGSYVGFGAEDLYTMYDIFEAVVPGTSGGGAGTDDDPLTTVVEYTTTVPPHIEPGAGAKPGTYEDYSDIIKLVCAWGGFYWPPNGIQKLSDGTMVPCKPGGEDPTLGREGVGRVWGDFEQTGTAGPTPLEMAIFDKKPLMDAVSYVRDIIGFIFMVDETGAVVWRAPNVFSVGNNIAAFSANPGRTQAMVEIDEKLTLMALSAGLNSRNVRESVFIANTEGSRGATAAGFNPNPVGLRRVGGWTDQNFATTEECQVMADLITVRQLFSYRTDTVRVPGFPKIQIDDQVRIYEQTTSEGYVHYVKGVSSSLSMETGVYTYDLQTHWLGEKPFEKWLFDPAQLSQATQDYLKAIRLERDGDTWFELPRGTTIPERLAVNMIFDGSHLTRGSGVGANNDFTYQLGISMASTTTASVRVANVAGGAITTPQLTQRAPTVVDKLYDATHYDGNILFVWEGSYHLANSVTATGDTPGLLAARARLREASAEKLAQSKEMSLATTNKATIKGWYDAAKTKYDYYKRVYDAAAKDLETQQDEILVWARQSQMETAQKSMTEYTNEMAMHQQGMDIESVKYDTAKVQYEAAVREEAAAKKAVAAEEARIDRTAITETEVHDAIKAYCAARRAKGWKVVVFTILPRKESVWTAGQLADYEGTRYLANSLIRTHWREYADALVDVAGDKALGKDAAYNDPKYYQSNKTYLTRAGHTLVAKYAEQAALTLIATMTKKGS